MMWGYHGDWGWWMGFGALMMVFFWGGIFLAIYWVVRSIEEARRPGGPAETPEEIVGRRLAAGEIGDDEYDRIVAKLDGGPAPS